MTTDTVKLAQFYADHNWQIFPCKPHDKTPLVKWADEATTDRARIADWWQQYPDANIGIATGARSGNLVLDIDAGHGGEESLRTLLGEFGDLPRTPQAHTGGGGRHVVFAHPGREVRNSAGKVAPGIDVRGDGGYIVAPPSIHPNGKPYQWISEYRPSTTPLAQAPGWLLDKMTAQQVLDYPQAPTVEVPKSGAVPTGSRNQVLTSLAGTMRRRGMGEEAILQALLSENQTKCVPPLSVAEVGAIAHSVCRYGPTAAPQTRNRDRIQSEWAFAKAMFDLPEMAHEFSWLSPDQFGDENIRKFWKQALETGNIIKAAEDASLLPDLEYVKADSVNIDIYARMIARFDYLHSISRTAADIQRLAEAGEQERVERLIETLAESKQTVVSGARDADEVLDELAESLETGNEYIPSGFPNLDAITGGLPRKTLSILAARPSMGKTTWAWQLARHVAAAGYRVVFLSLEVSAVSLWRQAAFGLAEISVAQVTTGKVSADTMERVKKQIIPELKQAYAGRLFVHDDPPFSTGALWKVVMQKQPDLVIIDHLGFVDEKAESVVAQLGNVTKWAKRLAKKSNSHVMVLHQLSRDVEKRDKKEPQLSDLRDSGHVEQDADIVLMPYRPSYYAENPAPVRYSETQLYIRKNRENPVGAVGLYMDMKQQWFYRREEMPANYASVRL